MAYDPIGDPENFRFHQAYLAYTGYDSVGRFGSQEILLDNQRFIGNIGWRLNGQSFNAASIKNNSISNLTLYYAYTDSINGADGKMNHDRQYHLVNAEYNACENNKASAFAYLQRNDGGGGSTNSIPTACAPGARTTSSRTISCLRSSATPTTAASLDNWISIPLLSEAALNISPAETTKTSGSRPLNGTAHKFNGWADQFLGTGGGLEGGLVDIYGQVSATAFEKLKLTGVLHYFNTADETDAGFSGEYGHEIDLLANYPVCKNFDVLRVFAYYVKGDNDADTTTTDETVFWLRGTLRF
jgi:hypothetical protein